MKIKGIQVNVKTGEIKEVFEEIPDEEYQKRLEEAKKIEGQERIRELIERKKQEILKKQAIEELLKEGKITQEEISKCG